MACKPRKIQRVVIVGAGAVGASYASRFFDMDSSCVSLAAAGERYDRLKAEGLVVNGVHYAFPVLSPEDDSPPADLILVTVKHYHLVNALPILKNWVGKDTVLLSLMNGLDSESIIGSFYGQEKILYATVVGINASREGNVIKNSKVGTIFFGEADNSVLSERVMTLQALFDRSGIDHQSPADMIRTLWWKFMINVGINQASAVLSAPYSVFQTSKHARQIMELAMREVISVAGAAGVDLLEQDIQDWYRFLEKLDPQGKTSMLQDIEAGRTTEVDIFAGKVMELGKTFRITTPINEFLYHAIKVVETGIENNQEKPGKEVENSTR